MRPANRARAAGASEFPAGAAGGQPGEPGDQQQREQHQEPVDRRRLGSCLHRLAAAGLQLVEGRGRQHQHHRLPQRLGQQLAEGGPGPLALLGLDRGPGHRRQQQQADGQRDRQSPYQALVG
jgi:hypothetical protein